MNMKSLKVSELKMILSNLEEPLNDSMKKVQVNLLDLKLAYQGNLKLILEEKKLKNLNIMKGNSFNSWLVKV